MRNFIIFLLPLASLATENFKPHPNCWLACDELGSTVFSMDCPVTPTVVTDCTCFDPLLESQVPCEGDIIITKWEECEALAQAKATDEGATNTHFRWKDFGDTQVCYLLDKCEEIPPCTGPRPDSNCVSGENPCEDIPIEDKKCDKIEWDVDAIHWVCNSNVGGINAYVEKSPEGTVCSTEKGCPTWSIPDAKLTFKCTAAVWTAVTPDSEVTDPMDNDDGDNVVSPKTDQQCQCEDLDLTGAKIGDILGTAFICDHPLDADNPKITSDNSCVLICDGHITMIISCYDGTWFNTLDYSEVTADKITCSTG